MEKGNKIIVFFEKEGYFSKFIGISDSDFDNSFIDTDKKIYYKEYNDLLYYEKECVKKSVGSCEDYNFLIQVDKEDTIFIKNCINYIFENYNEYNINLNYFTTFISPFFDYYSPILLLYIEKLNDIGIGFTFNRNQCTYVKGGKFIEFYKKNYFHINVSNFDDFKAILNKQFNIFSYEK